MLQVESDGLGGFLTDEIIFADGTVPDLTNVKIEFAFVGDTDPNAFADTGNWILDTFLKIFRPMTTIPPRRRRSKESRRSKAFPTAPTRLRRAVGCVRVREFHVHRRQRSV